MEYADAVTLLEEPVGDRIGSNLGFGGLGLGLRGTGRGDTGTGEGVVAVASC